MPRSRHAEFDPRPGRKDPVELLIRQGESRLPDLVPIWYGRMLESPDAFSRGAAIVMTFDLAATPNSGLCVQACGDAHHSNFGVFATSDGGVILDINDFDETLRAPWEWDVKRLAASLAVAGRHNRFLRNQRAAILRGTVRAYRDAIRNRFAPDHRRAADDWLKRTSRTSDHQPARHVQGRPLDRTRARASMQTLSTLTRVVDGARRIISDPPLIMPVEEAHPVAADEVIGAASSFLRDYRRVVAGNRGVSMDGYRLVHLARKAVGVGSVGVRTWIALLAGTTAQDLLFLQLKEAQAPALELCGGIRAFEDQGQRVVAGQRRLQVARDDLLGWGRMPTADGIERTFYARRLNDWIAPCEIETMSVETMAIYGRLCGVTLARAHARSHDRVAIGSYLGGSDVFDRSLAEFAEAYADQTETDYYALVEAQQTGRIEAQTGL